MALQTFQNALGQVRGDKLPHLLLGNGFSRACRDDIFSYDSLFDRADFRGLPRARQAFEALDTTDFEVVMNALKKAAALMPIYSSLGAAAEQQMRADAEALKDVLVRAIADNHPEHPNEIPNDEYARCRAFLSNFDRWFTVNYDLLLYWTVMRSELDPPLRSDDGFRTPEDGAAEYVSWEPENTDHQNMYYLHGALHIFDSKTKVQKYTWANTGVRLIVQIRDALDRGLYPLFVAEGESVKKVERIRHSDFLDKTYRSILRIGGAMFIHGHSLAPNDDHILRGIAKSKVKQLFVGIFGDEASDANRQIVARAEALRLRRRRGATLEVQFYDSGSVRVWR